jgi:hypothetical protein
VHGLRVSVGEIVELLHRIKHHMQPHLDALKEEIRASPAVQADEDGLARIWQQWLHLEREYPACATTSTSTRGQAQ